MDKLKYKCDELYSFLFLNISWLNCKFRWSGVKSLLYQQQWLHLLASRSRTKHVRRHHLPARRFRKCCQLSSVQQIQADSRWPDRNPSRTACSSGVRSAGAGVFANEAQGLAALTINLFMIHTSRTTSTTICDINASVHSDQTSSFAAMLAKKSDDAAVKPMPWQWSTHRLLTSVT